MRVYAYLICVLSALCWSPAIAQSAQASEWSNCTVISGRSFQPQTVRDMGLKIITKVKAVSVCHCCQICGSQDWKSALYEKKGALKVGHDCVMFIFSYGESRCYLIDARKTSAKAIPTAQDKHDRIVKLLSYTEEDRDFAVGVSVEVADVAGAQRGVCQSNAYNSAESDLQLPNRPSKTFIPSGEADGHFRTDQDAPDVTNSDPNDWHMHQWPETNDFLKSRVQSFSNLTLMNGDPPHVFFVFTSDDPRIRLKARCALESATRIAKLVDSKVTIYSNHLTREVLNGVDLGSDITIVDYELEELFSKTRLYDWYIKSKEMLLEDKFLIAHMSDAVRTALLWKKGGLYLDTDVVVMRDDIWHMPPSFAKQKRTGGSLNGAVIKIGPYHPFTHALMNLFVDNFNPDSYSENGPIAITKTYSQQCGRLLNAVNCPISCGVHPYNIIAFPNNAFYPVTYGGPRLLALFHDLNASRVENEYKIMKRTGTFAIHLWASRTTAHHTKYKLVRGSLVEKIFKDSLYHVDSIQPFVPKPFPSRCPDTHGYIFERERESSTRFNYSHWDLYIKQEQSSKEDPQGCFCNAEEAEDEQSCGFHCDFEHIPNVAMLRNHGDLSFGPNASSAIVVSSWNPDRRRQVEYIVGKDINVQKCVFEEGYKRPTRGELKAQRQMLREAFDQMTFDDDVLGYDKEPQDAEEGGG